MFKISLKAEEVERLPYGAFKGEIIVIDKPGKEYNAAISYLKKQSIIGFDTETRPIFEPHRPARHVALMQLSGPDKAFLFRIFMLGIPASLASILSDEKILKIGAACHDDVRGLQYYSRFEGRSFVDLQKIVWQWGIRDKSVKKLSANILKFKISKAQQCSNWEADVLSEPQLSYAATDAWVCLEMYKKLMLTEYRPLTQEQIYPPQPKPASDSSQQTEPQKVKAQTADSQVAKTELQTESSSKSNPSKNKVKKQRKIKAKKKTVKEDSQKESITNDQSISETQEG